MNESAQRCEEQIISLFQNRQAFTEPIYTAAIKNRRIGKWIYRMRNVSW